MRLAWKNAKLSLRSSRSRENWTWVRSSWRLEGILSLSHRGCSSMCAACGRWTENGSLWDLVHKQLSILTLPMQVKHLMLLLGGGTAQRTRRRRRKVIMPLNLNSNWDQIKREDHAANKAQTQKRKPSLKFYLVWWDSRSMKPVEPTLMKRLWCSSEHRCWRES